MESDAQSSWTAFLRYRHRTVEILNEADHIGFRQWRKSASRTVIVTLVAVIAIFVLFIASGIFAIVVTKAYGLGNGGWLAFLIPLAIGFYFIVTLIKMSIVINTMMIIPGHVIWDWQYKHQYRWKQGQVYNFEGLTLPWPISDKALVIPISEIKTIDIRQGDTLIRKNDLVGPIREEQIHVVLWHGPVPIYTLAAPTQEDALTLKEGVIAAIGVINSMPDMESHERPVSFPE